MTRKRRYQLMCPIARALDAVGDRWSLLILRDLHAGPAGFQELQDGLGVASNLLSTRLTELTEAGLVHKLGSDGRGAYALTDLGRRTDRVLWELVQLGGQLEHDHDPREPGNLRTLALPLRIVLESVEVRPALTVGLIVDGERFTVTSAPETVAVEYGDTATADLVVRTDYEALLDVAEELMPLDEFAAGHVEVVEGQEHADAFFGLMAEALTRVPGREAGSTNRATTRSLGRKAATGAIGESVVSGLGSWGYRRCCRRAALRIDLWRIRPCHPSHRRSRPTRPPRSATAGSC